MATSPCILAHPSTDLSRADALAQLQEIQPSFVRTRAVDPEAFLLGVKQVATSLTACSFLGGALMDGLRPSPPADPADEWWRRG